MHGKTSVSAISSATRNTKATSWDSIYFFFEINDIAFFLAQREKILHELWLLLAVVEGLCLPENAT